MNDAAKQNLSGKAKQRWQDAKDLAPILGLDKEIIFNAHAKIRHLIPMIRGNDAAANIEARRIIQEGSKPKVKIHKYDSEDDELTPADELRIAMWLINKIGNIDRAIQVIQAAAQAARKLS